MKKDLWTDYLDRTDLPWGYASPGDIRILHENGVRLPPYPVQSLVDRITDPMDWKGRVQYASSVSYEVKRTLSMVNALKKSESPVFHYSEKTSEPVYSIGSSKSTSGLNLDEILGRNKKW
ncbi:MAG: hypothetical protein NTV63_02900 [Candidatus Woesearchaeota archaeon]|nr:hypothetical protein [Candidatus Woesearchaeota archaeon]